MACFTIIAITLFVTLQQYHTMRKDLRRETNSRKSLFRCTINVALKQNSPSSKISYSMHVQKLTTPGINFAYNPIFQLCIFHAALLLHPFSPWLRPVCHIFREFLSGIIAIFSFHIAPVRDLSLLSFRPKHMLFKHSEQQLYYWNS